MATVWQLSFADGVPSGGSGVGSRATGSDLLERARAGDVRAFEGLYRQNVGRVHAVCLRVLADESQAEDATQETFIRAWKKLSSFEGRSAFSTWLHRMAVNVSVDTIRSLKRRRVFEEIDEDVETRESPVAGSHGASTEVRIDLERAISALPPGARTAFVLHDIEGYKHREIAEMTGVAEGTWKAQLHRARKLLREEMR